MTVIWRISMKIKTFKNKLIIITFLLLLFSCSAGINTTKGMLGKLKKAGHTIKKQDSFSANYKVDDAFWLLIDGEKIAVYKFINADDAKKYESQLQNGFVIDIWGFEHARPKVQDKIKKALQ